MRPCRTENTQQHQIEPPPRIHCAQLRDIDKQCQHQGNGDHLVKHQAVARDMIQVILLKHIAQDKQKRRENTPEHPLHDRPPQTIHIRPHHDHKPRNHDQSGNKVLDSQLLPGKERFYQNRDHREAEKSQYPDSHRGELYGVKKGCPV